MVAAAAVKKLLWPLIAVLAVGFLAILSQHGERPEPGVDILTPSGFLAGIADAEIETIDIESNAGRATLVRGPNGGWLSGGAVVTGARAERIVLALRVARNAAAERHLSAGEIAGAPLAQYGLETPSLTVRFAMAGGRTLAVRFGGLNPIGLGVYAQLAGQEGILLLPAYALAAWRDVLAP